MPLRYSRVFPRRLKEGMQNLIVKTNRVIHPIKFICKIALILADPRGEWVI